MSPESHLYEAERGELSLAATGDSLMARPISSFREERFLALLDLIRGADVAFTNLETQVHRFEPYPSAVSGGTYTAAHPELLKELEWAGFAIVSSSNNHAYDYGEGGVLTTLENLEASSLVFSGLGRNLSGARAPGYLESPVGRVALLSTTSTFPEAARAGEQRHELQGRPGASTLGSDTTYVVDKTSFKDLRRIRDTLGTEGEAEHRRHLGFGGDEDTDTAFHFLGGKFAQGEGFATRTSPDESDMNDIMRWVGEARRQADWVLLSIHSHEFDGSMEQPAQFLHTFARRCIDEGVDAVLGHGPHLLRGIEVYKGKPILYSLGNFIFQNEAITRFPTDIYSRVGLDLTATPADYYDARSQKDTRGFPADPLYWESVVAVLNLKREGPGEVRLHPVDLGYGRPRSQRGRPLLADEELGGKILTGLQGLSRAYGTEIKLVDGVGVIDLPPA